MRVVFVDSICDPARPGVGGVSDIQWRLARELLAAGDQVTMVGAYDAGVRGPDPRVKLVAVPGAVVRHSNVLKHMARALRLARAAAAVPGVDVFTVPDSVTAAALVLCGRGRRVVWHGHSNVYHHSRNGVPWDRTMFTLMRSCTHLAAPRIGRVIALGASLVPWWQRGGFAPERITVIPLGVDAPPTPNIAWQEPEIWRDAAYRLLYVGRLSAEKGGYGDLFDALPVDLGAQLLIIGDGPSRAGVEQEIATRGLAGAVSCIGQQESGFVTLAYQRADLVILPSRNEMLPRVMLEAWASGAPFMATAVGAIPDYLRDGENGFLLTSTAPAYLRERIRTALADPRRRAIVAEGGRTTAAALSWPSVAASFRVVYQELQNNGVRLRDKSSQSAATDLTTEARRHGD